MFPFRPPSKSVKWFFLLPVIVIWLVLGHLQPTSLREVGWFYHSVLTLIGFPEFIYQSLNSDGAELTKYGSRLISASYDLLYCTLSLLIIHLYVRNWSVTKITIGLFVVISLLTVLINEVGKIISYEPFRILAYRLMTVVVSPLPVVLIIAAVSFYVNSPLSQNADSASGQVEKESA